MRNLIRPGYSYSEEIVWGILGGMGPIASAELVSRIYHRAADGRREQMLPRLVLQSDPSIPDRSAALESGQSEALLAHMRQSLRKLELAGAEIVVIACITAHAFLETLRISTRLPILSLVDLVREDDMLHHRRLLLASTTGTVRSDIFLNMPSSVVMPSPAGQAAIHAAIYLLKSSGDDSALQKVLAEQVAAESCDGLIAGCTEISLVSDRMRYLWPVLDPMDAVCDRVLFHRPITELATVCRAKASSA